MSNFADHIASHGLRTPGKPAIILPDRLVTYGMLLQGILSVQQKIVARGIAGPLIAAVMIDNPVRHVILTLALARLGIATTSLTEHQLEKIPDIGIGVYFCDNLYHRALAGKNAVLVTQDWFATTGLTLGRAPGFPDRDHVCRVSFSSGTTGVPKAIATPAGSFETQLAYRMLMAQAMPSERVLNMTGMTTESGYRTAITTLWLGHTSCQPSSAQEALQLTSVYGVQLIACSTQQLRVLLECQAEEQFSCDSVRLIRVGGSAVSSRLLQQAQKLICQKVLCSYSSTENGPSAYALADSMPDPRAAGRIASWASVEAADADASPLPAGTSGRIRVKTGTNWGYFQKGHSLTSLRSLEWFYPGDEGLITPDGWLILTGRTSEIINSGGVKLAPHDLEEFLAARADIVDVAAIGMLGSAGIEELWLAIVPGPAFAEDTITRACVARDPNVVPERIVRVPAIPRSATGKILRDPLKATLASSSLERKTAPTRVGAVVWTGRATESELVVETDAADVHARLDLGNIFCLREAAVGKRVQSGTGEPDVHVLSLHRPIVGDGIFRADAGRVAAGGLLRGTDGAVIHTIAHVAVGVAARGIDQRAIESEADAAAHGAKVANVVVRRIEVRVAELRSLDVGLNAEHEAVHLIIVADLATNEITARRLPVVDRSKVEHAVTFEAGFPAAPVHADIEAGPREDRHRVRGRRHGAGRKIGCGSGARECEGGCGREKSRTAHKSPIQ
ncbi:MAG: hypothetical protein JWM36_2877 [Hyphomicrobiales bacterium]|nr:hypothetical protein [Hyphomicrobiales bacterium]